MKTSFLGLLTIVFVALKLTNYIDWSWWLVLLPLYGGFVLSVILFWLFAIIIAVQQKVPISDSVGGLLKVCKQANKNSF